MPALAVRAATLNGLTARRRGIFEIATADLRLGDPVIYKEQNTRWAVWDDSRITPGMLATLGALLTNFGRIPNAWRIPVQEDGYTDRRRLHSEIRSYLVDVLVEPPGPPEDPTQPYDPYQAALDAQGVPRATMRAFSAIPDNWTVDPNPPAPPAPSPNPNPMGV